MSNETQQMKTARESAEKTGNAGAEITEGGWPFCDGVPMVKISCAAAELAPTVQFGNATVGPVSVTCFVTPDGRTLFDVEALGKAITAVQSRCEQAVAEDRETVAILMRSRAKKAA